MVANGLITMQNPKQKKRSLEFTSSSSSPILKRRKSNDFSIPKDVRLGNKGIHWVTFDQKRGRCEVSAKQKIQSRTHTKCSHSAENFKKVDSGRVEDIKVMRDSQKKKEKEQNRASLKRIFDTIIICGEN
ncbi:hypothetical protein J6590_097791 [Homalodisca vitripennis]|nr:hypothetical protein J6590_097791 [Homalodisca vitripennis]